MLWFNDPNHPDVRKFESTEEALSKFRHLNQLTNNFFSEDRIATLQLNKVQ